MDFVKISPNIIIPEPCDGDMGSLLDDEKVSLHKTLEHAPHCPDDSNSDKIAKRRSLKRKFSSSQSTRKGLKVKKVKGSDMYSPNESPVVTNAVNGQMPCTPASSSSPGESMSERKLIGSIVDNVYEFTEQEEGHHKLPDEHLLKRKRSTRNYGKPKNRWLLEAEMKSITESRQRSYSECNQMELPSTKNNLHSIYNSASNDSDVLVNKIPASGNSASRVTDPAGHLQCPKIRINRNPSKNGTYECHIIERSSALNGHTDASSLISYRTECGDIFSVGDVVWAKLVGWPWWPAKLQSFYADAEGRHTGTAEVRWFNWDQISYVKCEKLYHFLAAYHSKLDKRRKAGAYKAAIDLGLKEAWVMKRRQSAHDSDLYNGYNDECNDGDDESNDSFEHNSVSPAINDAELQSKPTTRIEDVITSSAHLPQLKIKSSFDAPQENKVANSYVSPVLYEKPISPKNAATDLTHELNKTVERSSKDNSDSRTSSHIIPHDLHDIHDFFDSSSVAVEDAFATFEESTARTDEMVNLGPLVDIGPNLSLLNPKNIYSCIPSFSDDDELDMRPVLDPASIENV